MRVLAFSFFPAFVPPTNGGQSRLFNFYRSLSKWHQVRLLTSTHIGVDEEVVCHGLNFVERRVAKDEFFIQQYTKLDTCSSGGDISGPSIATCGRYPTALHKAYLEEYESADIIIHDSPFTFDYDFFSGIDNKPRIYNSYNCEFDLYKQLHPSDKSRPIHELVRDAEQRLLNSSDIVLYCNERDLERFRELAPNAKFEAIYAPNGMTPILLPDRLRDNQRKQYHAVFMGSGHPPNAHAAEFIVNTLAPTLPEITFDILGNCLPEGNYARNVKRHGVVDDATKSSILLNADIALNPMAEGSGSNVKVLEYFSFGLPVLSTLFGMRGINAHAGVDYLEAPIEGFSEVLGEIAISSSNLPDIGNSGRALALASYTWEAIVRPVADRLKSLVNRRTTSSSPRYVVALNDYDSFASYGGGCTRTRGLYEAVCDWTPVVFITFSGDGTLSSRKHSDAIAVINVPKTDDHIAEVGRTNAHYHVAADDIIAIMHSVNNPWLTAVYDLIRKHSRSVVVEHCYMVGLPITRGDRFVYSSHNCEAELKKRLLEFHPLKFELLSQVERAERLAVERSAATIAVSREDADNIVKGKASAGPVIVVRNGAATPLSGEAVENAKQKLREQIGDTPVVFLGSAHMPNVDAAKFIVESLASQCAGVIFHIVGSVCSALQHVPANVHLWGEVDEVTKCAVMQSCLLALNPVTLGSGSNVKLADYLGNGLFVITTDFGHRGYPECILEHVSAVPLDKFGNEINRCVGDPSLSSKEARKDRKSLFARELSMHSLGQRFVETLQQLETKRKRVLYVAYRYSSPALGGAETNIEKFVDALGSSGKFDVDVIAPEVSGIHNHLRFSEAYTFDADVGVPIDIPNVRFARFEADNPDPRSIHDQLSKAWSAQPVFERALDQMLSRNYQATGLTWGWGYPEADASGVARWAFLESGLFLHQSARIDIEGYAHHPVVTSVCADVGMIAGPWALDGAFSLSFNGESGRIRLVTSAAKTSDDPRPLGIRVSRLLIDGKALNLSLPTLLQKHLPQLPAEQCFRMLDQAAEVSRVELDVRLTDGRGPWSRSLERFIADHVADYDLVVTHNNVFRPAVVAIEEAKRCGVPSILIPHAHLDDDYYHFPDWLESARNASLVLAVPKAACDFLAEKGCNVRYFPAGCDASEAFSVEDLKAFREIYSSSRPFVLVLGRKAGAKGYRHTIDAVEQLNRAGIDLQVVLIGPDDDGVVVDSSNVVYFGRQPRNVVRGALLSCLALCNMSSSESFGIVLLEAWLAGKPVIANKNCAAFHDMALDGENALLVGESEIAEAISKVISDTELAERLGKHGRAVVDLFDWSAISAEFVQVCQTLAVNDQRLQ